jgi:hypothetical protein
MARTVVLTASNGVPVYRNLHTADCWEGMVFGGDCVLMPEQRDTVQSAQERNLANNLTTRWSKNGSHRLKPSSRKTTPLAEIHGSGQKT